ncbi:L,D-transpeptidase [Actinoplanes aureus]|uniref:L,D-transpeptidase family protein n=1 Tax=Actinoplanes aureus TaxID=2792083 RepID=A0A931CDQ8_9ACTN|nr:Ig-like domain-containing protein [Actinoplanes aureus]MBG0563020.1 L,D-transpeptidase family protein [Actinoplanes aureus]
MDGIRSVELAAPAGRAGRRGWRAAVVTLLAGTLLLTAACSGGDDSPSWQGGGNGAAASEAPSPEPTLSTVAVTSPAADATGVEAWSDVKFNSEDPENTTVKVTDAKGDEVKGAVDKDENLWRPTESMEWGKKYTVTVTTPEAEGKNNTTTSSFTVMKKPANLVRVTSFLADGQTVGVGMPLIMRFGRAIPEKYRADVERKMVVTATPAQEGVWHWTSPTEVHYRPQTYWKAGSKVFYKVQLKGVKMGDGWYGRSDLTVDMKIGRSMIMTVSNKTKKMTVKQDGKVIKTIPVSLGKPKTPSSSGTMVVIEKKEHTVFDTLDELGPEEGYRTEIDYAQRITWSGQFIHAAPWSEGVQGRSNVSHGCVNVSMAMGKWLFDRTLMGDVITVTGTEEKLKNGNGWTDWNMSWAEYKKGSALH